MFGPILRQIDKVNAFTLSGLGLAILSVTFALQGQFPASLTCLIWCGMVDLFDGFLARKLKRTPTQGQVGQQLDSLVDLCAFGFAPALFGFCFGLRGAWLVLLIAYACANAARLAYFNVAGLSGEGDQKYFTGLPVTYAALAFPLCFVVRFFASGDITRVVLVCTYAVLAVAMVSGAKIPKPRGVMYVLLPLLAVFMTGLYGWAIATGRASGL